VRLGTGTGDNEQRRKTGGEDGRQRRDQVRQGTNDRRQEREKGRQGIEDKRQGTET